MLVSKNKFNRVVTQNKKLEEHLGLLANAVVELNNFNKTSQAKAYTSKATQVNEIKLKYKGLSTKGAPLLQRIINLRVAFSVPNRVFLMRNPVYIGKVSDKEFDRAKEYLTNFLSITGLDGKLARDLAIQAELEGQVLLELDWEQDYKIAVLNYLPWDKVGYTVEATNEYRINSPLVANAIRNGNELALKADDFAFIAFNDELNEHQGYPTTGPILREIENLHNDLTDWRKLNHLYAHPTPHFTCESVEEANNINQKISQQGWRVGLAIATNAGFELKGPSGVEATLLMNSIQTNAKIISGHTGLGIHFLGFANVMSNRATADSMGEPTEIVLHSEIMSWKAFYTDLFNKAIKLRNRKLNAPIKENIIIPKLVPITDRQWRIFEKIYTPMAKDNLLSKSTLFDKMPDIDAEAEMERIKEEEAKAVEANSNADGNNGNEGNIGNNRNNTLKQGSGNNNWYEKKQPGDIS